ncbi:MAG: ribbon-helix-helix protein, CopG family [Leptospirales bacterium]
MKKQFCSIRLPEEILREIEKIAKEEDRSRSAVIRRIVQQFFSKEEEDERTDCAELGGEGGEDHAPRFSLDEREMGGGPEEPR